MADKKISALTAATTPLAGTEVLPIVQGGATVKVSVDNLTAGKPVSMSNLTYTGTATGGTGVINIGSGQVYKDASGNVGVGTVAPVYKLNVVASDGTNTVGGSAAAINITNSNTTGFGKTVDLNFSVGAGAVAEKIAGLSAVFTNYSSSVGGALAFCTNNGSGSFAEGMRLHSSKGVSIGDTTDPGAGNLRLGIGNLVIGTAGKGIDFSADPSAAGMTSELLDDYEEGEWVPVISDGTNNATMAATSANNGRYTKTGRMVVAQANIVVSSIGSVTGGIRITGLPFASAAGAAAYNGLTVGFAGGLAITAGHSVAGFVEPGQAYISLYVWDATTGTTAMQATEFTSSGNITITATYFV